MVTQSAQSLIEQMKTLAAQASGDASAAAKAAQQNAAPGFGDALMSSLDKINDVQMAAKTQTKAFQMGEPGVELHQVMLDNSKASLAFEAAVQVRNKAISAYKDIMSMQV